MRDGIKGKLDSIFERHAEKESTIAEKKRIEANAVDEFRAGFGVTAEKIIKPTLDELSQYLLGKGQRSRVVSELEETRSSAGLHRAAVTIRLLFDDDHAYRTGNENAHLAFMADKDKKHVIVFQNTMRPQRGGQGGSVGSFPLDTITPEFVQEKAADWLAKVFG